MNSLTITLCVLIEATVIIAETERLTNSSATLYDINLTKLIDIRAASEELYDYPSKSSKFLYSYNYNTNTGIQTREDGYLKNVNSNQEVLEVRGSYSYTDNEGNTFQVSYIANENGFQPKVVRLPTLLSLIKKTL